MPERQESENQILQVEPLLALLPKQVRTNAAAVLAPDDAQSVQLLTDIIAGEHAARRMRATFMVTSGALMASTIPFAMAQPTTPWYLGIAGIGGILLLSFSALTCVPTALEKMALEAVARSNNKQNLGALLEGVQTWNLPPALRTRVKQALIHRLLKLTPEDAGLLTPAQRTQLYSNLNYIQRDSDLELRLATVTVLQNVGDRNGLGVIYGLAGGEAATHTAQMVRAAARDCLEHLGAHLDFGPLTQIQEYTENVIRQMQSEGLDFQIMATSMLGLRQLLPRLQASDYRHVLSERQRDRLYQLLTMPCMANQDRYGINEVQEEILWTAHRMADIRALGSVRRMAILGASTPASIRIGAMARETLRLLEVQLEKDKESKTLLRGASAPASQSGELLRAAAPTESETEPGELLRATRLPPERTPFKIELLPEESKVALLQRMDDHRP